MKKENSKSGLYKILVVALILVIALSGFLFYSNEKNNIPADLKWSERMALSEIKRNPEPWLLEFSKKPRWSYTNGLVLFALIELSEVTANSDYYAYAERYADKMVDDEGGILTYEIDEFNIDHVQPGMVLLSVYKQTKEEKYLKALKNLRKQLEWQPRNTVGGFWHKLRYPWQMWLDGLYMGSPFYSRYTVEFAEDEKNFDDVVNQIVVMEKYARDSITGLLYHGWDESTVQKWADPVTGLSKNFWGRAMGWYAMALVDVLDYLPEDHKGRAEVISILDRLASALVKYQDKSGLWYQVVDQGSREGNYLEASCSSMIVYAIAKGVNKGYLTKDYLKYAEKGYDGIINNLIKVNEHGEVTITNVCSVAGLGGSPYRDGTFEYYISEPRRDNDPKATGPFILASIELDK